MKKSLIIGGIVAGIVLVPVLGMAISPTRDLILGMAPDTAVLSLADKIDENRVNVDSKTAELQSLIDTQRTQIAEQQSIIDDQKAELDKQKVATTQAQTTANQAKADVAATQATVAKNKDCSADVSKYCVSKAYTDPDEFKKFLKTYENLPDYPAHKEKYTNEFNKCQIALKCE